ncbi:nitronate monooxygenase [Halomicroarcula sp. S1AR25-4]|uniref:NAD(P)H-dependent flavin oxidoreductase n=1 Tax=Haloarcula sp. S1AR25-4 TaxID=2950538 RepID=UPI0028756D8B|nr:nitronate monooxygenase [Halomicroarcula sp. S1AR25-4]MDS0276278.1 nitronate monooxygenase [Halomicroarcula sp. S1AR25-4]
MPSLYTPLCDVLGIEAPVVQAPVGSVSTPALAAAVADAGGLGTLAMSWRDEDAIRASFEAATDRTDGVVGVNVVLDESTGELSPGDCLDVCLDAGASVVSLSFGDPTPYVDRVHDAGGTVLVSVGCADEARRAVDAGADVVVTQGSESGGHLQSDVTTMALVPSVADAVDVPVVAAGGISDGRGMAAALTLGADGAWLGTRFVATTESGAHPSYRRRIAAGSATETRRTEQFDVGWPDQPHRVLDVDDDIDAAHERDSPVARRADGTPIARDADLPPLAGMTGGVDALPHYAGQSAGGVETVASAGEVVASLVRETRATLDRTAERGHR